jgi:type VI secretion system secreted protein VgrG
MKNKRLILSATVALAGFLHSSNAAIPLGSADTFAVLGSSTVTSTGNTILNGNLGVDPGSSITGFLPGIVNGTTYDTGGVAAQAQADALTAYNTLAGEARTGTLTGQDLGGLTLTPGVYFFSSSAQLTKALTLSGQGDFIFQIGSTLTTASGSSVLLMNGAQAANVFWQVGSSATLGTGTLFNGSILADQSITFDTGADMFGSAVALNGAVTLDDNVVTVPDDPTYPTAVPEPAALWPTAFLASVFGAGQWLANRRRKRICHS